MRDKGLREGRIVELVRRLVLDLGELWWGLQGVDH